MTAQENKAMEAFIAACLDAQGMESGPTRVGEVMNLLAEMNVSYELLNFCNDDALDQFD